MEYIEYFFGNFWHFVALLLLCAALSPKITINNREKDD